MLEEYIVNYLNFCRKQKNLSANTIRTYGLDLGQFKRFIHGETIVTRMLVQNYMESLNDTHKPASVKRKFAVLRSFFYYVEEEYGYENPFLRLKFKIKEQKRLPRLIPAEMIQHLLKTLYKQKTLETSRSKKYAELVKDIAVLELLFATGLRVSELCALSKSDIDIQTGNALIYGKGGKMRLVYVVNAEVIEILREYASIFAASIIKTDCFFINRVNKPLSPDSVRSMIRRRTEEAKIPIHITPHMFRHSFATLLLEEDVDIRYIQHFLGHSSIVTTQIYTHVSVKKQRAILSAKHPRNNMSMT
ncbi:MAG: tyrosine-type recombinase/integrase [Treponema sp.]|nr:tyrosine-type recombinase/integrase [Treponema sp.]